MLWPTRFAALFCYKIFFQVHMTQYFIEAVYWIIHFNYSFHFHWHFQLDWCIIFL